MDNSLVDVYYNTKQLDNTGADYRVVVSERSGGKSYDVKRGLLKHAYETGNKFAYIRRWKDEVTQTAILQYFDDMVVDDEGNERIREITNNEYDCIDVYAQQIFFAKIDDTGKKIRGAQIGNAFCLVRQTKTKSRSFVRYDRAVFEEFITDEGYAPDELKLFKSVISTVFRRRKGIIYLVGNTLTPVCPYFNYWKLDVHSLKQGTITTIIHPTGEKDSSGAELFVKVAVEYPEPTGKPSQLFFEDDKMIRTGAWDTREYPALEGKLTDYDKRYIILFEYTQFRFWLNVLIDKEGNPFIYIYPSTKRTMTIDKDMRVVSDRYSPSRRWTKRFSDFVTRYDKYVVDLLEREKVVFSDDLTGTNFYQCLHESGGI